MSTESANHKFGLPKPDFQNVSKKRSRWSTVLAAMLIACIAVGKIIYHCYWVKEKQNIGYARQTTTDKTASPPAVESTLPNATAVGTNIHVEIDEAISYNEAFGYKDRDKNKSKKTEDIKAVQKQLEEKQKNPKPLIKPGTYQELYEPQGIYHLVVISHLDKQFAMRTVQQLMRKNMGVCLILPRKGERYYRVTIAHSKTKYEANVKLKQLKPVYKDLFILKY